MFRSIQVLLLTTCLVVWGGALHGQVLSPLDFFPGDAAVELSAQTQDWPEVAAGGPGYLVVWEDKRPVLESLGTTPNGQAFSGNGYDIYGALLDAQGQVIKSPIVIANQGRNQNRPDVAWNGESFLVVWTSERPDWYFFEDIMGIRVSAEGTLLDPAPIMLRAETNDPSNNYAQNPRVTSDGSNWFVVWQDILWQEFTGLPNIAGVRVAPDGTIIDPEPVVVHQQFSVAFPPIQPDVAFAGDEYLVVWDDFGEVRGRRVDLSLQPLGPSSLIADFSSQPRVASDGTDFLVTTPQYRAYRVNHAGQVLDPGGIDFDIGGDGWQPSGPAVAWDGSTYSIPFGSTETVFSESELWEARIDPAGNLTGPVKLFESADTEWNAAVAPGGGSAQIVWSRRAGQVPEDIRTLRRAPDGTSGPQIDVGTGLHRQAYLRFASNGDEHLGVFLSVGGGQRRLMAQRVASDGTAIDPEPTVITNMSELDRVIPDVAFDGVFYLVAWADKFGSILGQRLATDGSLIDPAPVELIDRDSAAGNFAVGALGGNFLVVYSHQVSGDLRYLKAARVRGSDLAVLDTPFFIGFNFANNPRVDALGDNWLVVWESQTRHDRSASTVRGIFVSPQGVPGSSFAINSTGLGDDPDLAVTGNRAMVTWWDTTTFGNGSLSGRMIDADGTLPAPQFLIADAAEEQRQPAVAWDGSQFVVAWMDFRGAQDIEHERADIYAARVDFDGNVLDPGGFPVTSGPLPEEYTDVAGSGGLATIGFSILHGEAEPEVQRLGKRVLGSSASDHVLPESFVPQGQLLSGTLADLLASDDNRVVIRSAPSLGGANDPAVSIFVEGTTTLQSPSELRFTYEGQASVPGVAQRIYLFNYAVNDFVPVGEQPATSGDSTATVVVTSNVGDFVGPAGLLRARIGLVPSGPGFFTVWVQRVDLAAWDVTP